MFPLLRRDGLVLAYVASNLLFLGLVLIGDAATGEDWSADAAATNPEALVELAFVVISTLGAAALHISEALFVPPGQYPHLYPALMSIYGAGNLSVFFLFMLHRQRQLQLQLLSPGQAERSEPGEVDGSRKTRSRSAKGRKAD